MKAGVYGIKNLQRIIPNLIEWTRASNEDFTSLKDMYSAVAGQFRLYNGHVAKFVGGIMETPKTQEQTGPVYEIVPEQKQKEAVDFLNKNLFTIPS